MFGEELTLALMQILKDDEESLKLSQVGITAQIQYNKKLQEKIKELAAKYDAVNNQSGKRKNKK